MPTRSFRFRQFADLRLEGVGAMHASFVLLLNVTEEDMEQGKQIRIGATLKCNAAKAYGSGKIIPWCTVKNNINNQKYILDAIRKSFIANHDEIIIGDIEFTLPRKNMLPHLEIRAGYVLDTGYTGSIYPFPRSLSKKIPLRPFKQV